MTKADAFSEKAIAKLKKKFFEHPLFPKLKSMYPDRDYDFQFELMVDYWQNKKRKPPQAISAFSNWLKYSQPDPEIQHENRRAYEKGRLDKLGIDQSQPVNQAGRDRLKQMKGVL